MSHPGRPKVLCRLAAQPGNITDDERRQQPPLGLWEDLYGLTQPCAHPTREGLKGRGVLHPGGWTTNQHQRRGERGILGGQEHTAGPDPLPREQLVPPLTGDEQHHRRPGRSVPSLHPRGACGDHPLRPPRARHPRAGPWIGAHHGGELRLTCNLGGLDGGAALDPIHVDTGHRGHRARGPQGCRQAQGCRFPRGPRGDEHHHRRRAGDHRTHPGDPGRKHRTHQCGQPGGHRRGQ